MQPLEQRHDLVSGRGIERTRRFIGQQVSMDYSPMRAPSATRWRFGRPTTRSACAFMR
jgi:hypothetical protein